MRRKWGRGEMHYRHTEGIRKLLCRFRTDCVSDPKGFGKRDWQTTGQGVIPKLRPVSSK